MTMPLRNWKPIVAAIATVLLQSTAHAADKDPVKIGVTTSLSGPYQAFGGEVKDGIQFAIDEANANGGVDGRKVEVMFADEQGNPDTGRREAGTLALKGYNLMLGGISSAVSLAISGQAPRMDALYIATLSKTNLLGGKSCNARTFRMYQSDAMDIAVLKPWLKKQTEKKWAILAADYAWGHDSADGFTAAAAADGKTVSAPIFAPFGATDFAPYITQLKDSGAEAVWIANSGADIVNFWKQAKQFGLMEKMKIVTASGVNSSTIKALGDISDGMLGVFNYSSTLTTPENLAFVKAWRAKYPSDPGFTSVQGYVGVRAILAAVEKAKSVKPADVAQAMGGLEFDTKVYGPAKIRADDHQLALPNYFGHVGRVNGELKPVIDQTFGPAESMPEPSKDCQLNKS
jgi:branched-chain amino acid transport system substrate-binding protein